MGKLILYTKKNHSPYEQLPLIIPSSIGITQFIYFTIIYKIVKKQKMGCLAGKQYSKNINQSISAPFSMEQISVENKNTHENKTTKHQKKNQGKEIILKPMLINTKEYNNTVKKDDSQPAQQTHEILNEQNSQLSDVTNRDNLDLYRIKFDLRVKVTQIDMEDDHIYKNDLSASSTSRFGLSGLKNNSYPYQFVDEEQSSL